MEGNPSGRRRYVLAGAASVLCGRRGLWGIAVEDNFVLHKRSFSPNGQLACPIHCPHDREPAWEDAGVKATSS